jgi:hypothetical protein
MPFMAAEKSPAVDQHLLILLAFQTAFTIVRLLRRAVARLPCVQHRDHVVGI